MDYKRETRGVWIKGEKMKFKRKKISYREWEIAWRIGIIAFFVGYFIGGIICFFG